MPGGAQQAFKSLPIPDKARTVFQGTLLRMIQRERLRYEELVAKTETE